MRSSKLTSFLASFPKLRAMDIFAGAGGLTIGLDQSLITKTEWAIEIDTSAARTFSRNMPDIKVYNQDANMLLDHTSRRDQGLEVETLRDLCGKRLPPMPKKGEVDFIYGGPPCQGFSGINRFRKANDIKNSLLSTYLSYVDYYRPRYVLLENVEGLCTHRLGSTQKDKHSTAGGIKRGTYRSNT